MRVALLLDRWDPQRGGAERAMAKLAEHLVARGDDVRVFALSHAAGAPGIAHRVLLPPLPRGALEVAFGRAAVRAAQRARCDVTVGIRHLAGVDVYWPHGGLHRATLAAGEASKGRAAGALSHALHRLSPKHRTFLRLEERLLHDGGARVVWCVSDLVRAEIAAAFPGAAPRLEVHPNGVDLARFHPRLRDSRRREFLARNRIAEDAPVIVFPGGNWRLKGWHVALAALRRVPPPWTLVAAGDGAARLERPRGLGGAVEILPRQDPRDLYGAADLVLQPTWRDPCSLATLEALASGVPVVTTRANGASSAIRTFAAGAIVAPGDDAALAYAIGSHLRPTPRARRAARDAVADRPETAWLGALAASLDAATSRPSRPSRPGAGP